MNKTIFVIGANATLAKEAIKVLAIDNTIITGGRTGCDVHCDITKSFVIPDDVDVVLNVAAAFGGIEDDDIIGAVQTNSLGMLNVCVASKKANVSHVLNISSMSAVHSPGSPYYSIYALTKKNSDEIAELYCTLNKIPLTILRPSQIYGDDPAFAKHQPFFYSMLDKAERGEDIQIYGSNDALRNYIHITDLCELIKRAIDQSIEGTYPCLYPTNVTFSQIAHTAQEVFNKGGETIFLDDKPATPDNVFDIDMSIYEKTGYQARIGLEEGIRMIKVSRERVRT